MFTSASSVCAVNHCARCIVPFRSSLEKHRFLVGTCSAQEKNELSLIEFNEDINQLDIISNFSHPDQIWALDSSPSTAGEQNLVVTSGLSSSSGAKAVRLWRIPVETSLEGTAGEAGSSFGHEPKELISVASFPQRDRAAFINSIKWHSTRSDLVMTDQFSASFWSISDGSPEIISCVDFSGEEVDKSAPNSSEWVDGGVCWDPHNSSLCAAAAGNNLKIIDSRKMEVTLDVMAHRGGARDVDYNPNKPNMVVTAGNDRQVKIWDLRYIDSRKAFRGVDGSGASEDTLRPTKILSGHSHWVYCAKYNPFHDQLLLSGGSDYLVNLWRVASLSSAPWLSSDPSADGQFEEDPTGRDTRSLSQDSEESSDGPERVSSSSSIRTNQDPPDVKVRSIDQHEESVYSIAWSPADAWMYCSLSYDGRVILNHVPSTEKYKILL